MLNIKEINPYYDKITLIGMMGTGKSKFGRLVANTLKYNFYDIDSIIEKKFKTTIKILFLKHGELFFRNIEKETIKKLVYKINDNNEKVIISIGGGAYDDKETRVLLMNNTNVIWLNTPIDNLVERIGDGSKRPMIKGDAREAIYKLLQKRKIFYNLCHYELNTDKLNQNQIVEKIISFISYKNNKEKK